MKNCEENVLGFFFQDEIHANDENIEHFHKKSAEIQDMLQSKESPLELQVCRHVLLRPHVNA